MDEWTSLRAAAAGESGGDDAGFHVRAERVEALSRTFDGQQEKLPQLAGKVEGTTVDTGDPGLDGIVQQSVERLVTQLQQFGQALGKDAGQLRDNAAGYRANDQDGAGRWNRIRDQLGGP